MADIKPSGDIVPGNQYSFPSSETTADDQLDLIADTPYKLPSSNTSAEEKIDLVGDTPYKISSSETTAETLTDNSQAEDDSGISLTDIAVGAAKAVGSVLYGAASVAGGLICLAEEIGEAVGTVLPASDEPRVDVAPESPRIKPEGGAIVTRGIEPKISPRLDLKDIPNPKNLDLDQLAEELRSRPHVRGSLSDAAGESFPKISSKKSESAHVLTPADHFRDDENPKTPDDDTKDDAIYLKSVSEHFIFDANDPSASSIAPYTVDENGENPEPTFSGSATHYNPLGDPDMKEIGEMTYSEYVNSRLPIGHSQAPISPLYPFIRMDPIAAQRAILSSYNRFHIPVADNEFRKGYRHIFITRPECYVCCVEGGLSDQAAYDEDFSSSYSRMPYLCELLSPSYISKINFTSDRNDTEIQANWNFLLSNRVTGMSAGNVDLGVIENATKSIPGYTVTTPSFLGGVANGTLELTFRDTKNLEVSEFVRLWMLYMHKRHYGIFAPPYNGYHRENSFFGNGINSQQLRDQQYWMMHPYDRAVEYPCTIFDIVTDEADSKILYMCTYLGAYPAGLSSPLTNENNAPITDAKVSVSFRYQCKIENRNTCMALFNHNAGLTDHVGRPVSWAKNVEEVLPILIQAEAESKKMYALGNYIGAAGMFTGSPYIVIGKSQRHPFSSGNTIDDSGFLYRPYLKFMPLNAPELVDQANLHLQHSQQQFTGEVVSISQDTNDYSTNDEAMAKLANKKVQEMNLADQEADSKKGFIGQLVENIENHFNITTSDVAESAGAIGVLGALIVGGPIAAVGAAAIAGIGKDVVESISDSDSSK